MNHQPATESLSMEVGGKEFDGMCNEHRELVQAAH